MKYFPFVILCFFGFSAHAGTLLCGDAPCDNVRSEKMAWPVALGEGLPLTSAPRVTLKIPTGFTAIHQHENLVSFSYSESEEQETTIFLVSSRIRSGEQSGPEGGWETLHEFRKGEIVIYYYESPADEDTYVAIIRNLEQERNSPFGTVWYLTLGAKGLPEEKFLQIIGSVAPRGAADQ
ncbi:MAG: hypothetical protein JJU06_00345 [Ectothiorhodospiraceae bacterium]|nr:hypothetical protein [Ectothiorhodospiraceae bacterium]MCH8506560.1 hypothetical protein [Ectothiorhodospiraceae bacterium]